MCRVVMINAPQKLRNLVTAWSDSFTTLLLLCFPALHCRVHVSAAALHITNTVEAAGQKRLFPLEQPRLNPSPGRLTKSDSTLSYHDSTRCSSSSKQALPTTLRLWGEKKGVPAPINRLCSAAHRAPASKDPRAPIPGRLCNLAAREPNIKDHGGRSCFLPFFHVI